MEYWDGLFEYRMDMWDGLKCGVFEVIVVFVIGCVVVEGGILD